LQKKISTVCTEIKHKTHLTQQVLYKNQTKCNKNRNQLNCANQAQRIITAIPVAFLLLQKCKPPGLSANKFALALPPIASRQGGGSTPYFSYRKIRQIKKTTPLTMKPSLKKILILF
jgi:hypothetical protein